MTSIFGFLKELLITLRVLFKWICRKCKRKRSFKEEIEVSDKIDKILEKVLDKTGADRAYVFQFHNGNYFYTGSHIPKMTNTNEMTTPGTSVEQIKCQDMMLTPYKKFINFLFDNEIYECYDTNNIVDINTNIFMESRGTKSVSAKLIIDSTKKSFGFIGIDFVKDNKAINLYSRSVLMQASESIYELLMYGKEKKEKHLLNG